MSCLMECRDTLFFIGYDPALFLGADPYFDEGSLNIFLLQVYPVFLSCQDCRLIQEIFKIRSCKSGSRLRDLLKVNILAKRFPFRMNFQDLFPSLYIRPAYHNLPVKAAGAQDCRIQDIYTVGSGHYDDSFIDAEAVHLYQQLVQRLLSLIMSAAHSRPAASRHGINLINENNAWRILLRFFEQIPYAGRANSDKHLYKVRA